MKKRWKEMEKRKRKKERKDSAENGAVYRERRRNCVRKNESALLATRKEKFIEP